MNPYATPSPPILKATIAAAPALPGLLAAFAPVLPWVAAGVAVWWLLEPDSEPQRVKPWRPPFRRTWRAPATNGSKWTLRRPPSGSGLSRKLETSAAGYQPPEGMKLDPRSRVVNLWHPEIAAALREMQPESRLLELIDSLDQLAGRLIWEGSASQFEQAKRGKDYSGILDRLFPTGQSAGRMLAELARFVPGRVEKRNWHGLSHYRVYPPKAD